MQETPVQCLRWENPLQKGEINHPACRTRPQGRKASNKTVCVWAGMREAERGLDLLPWHEHGAGCSLTRAGSSNAVYPPLWISYQPTGVAGGAGGGGGGNESRGVSWLSPAWPMPETPEVHVGLGGAIHGFGLRPCHPADRINPRLGVVSSAQRPNCQEIPLGSFEVAAHVPFPNLPCLPKRSGFSRLFIFHTSVGLNCLCRLLLGIPEHFSAST